MSNLLSKLGKKSEGAAEGSKADSSEKKSLTAKLGLGGAFSAKSKKTMEGTIVSKQKTSVNLSPNFVKGYLKKNLSDGIKVMPRGMTEMYIQTDLENGKSIFWKMTDTTLEQIESIPDSELVASFGQLDIRVPCEKNDGFGQIQKMLDSDADSKTYPINRAKEYECAYGTAVSRINELTYRMGPGQQVLEALVAEKLQGEDDKPGIIVYGLQFKDSNSGTSLTILFSKDSLGGTGKPLVTINSDNVDFVLSQFLAQKKIPKQQARIFWFTNSEFLSASHEIHLYPNEAVFQGIPVRKLLWIGVLGSALASVGGAGWLSFEFTRNELVKKESEQAVAEKTQIATQNAQTVANSLNAFSKIMSLNVDDIFKKASSLWIPGSVVQIQAGPAETVYTIKMTYKDKTPRLPGGGFASDRFYFKFVPEEQYLAMLKPFEDENCTKSQVKYSGDLNEAEFTITCPNSDSRLSRYRSQ